MHLAERVIDIRDGRPTADGPGPGVGGGRPAVWLSGQEAAAHVGVSWPTLREAIIEHAIPHVRLGRRWKIEVSVLDEHLRQMARSSAGRA